MSSQELCYVIPEGTTVHVVTTAKEGYQMRYKHVLRERLEFRERGWAQENRERWGFVVKRDGRSFTVWANIADVTLVEPNKKADLE